MNDPSIGASPTIPANIKRHAYSLQENDRVGDYLIIHPLGKGGMGQVYLAKNIVTEKSVALKLLPPDVQGREFLERFRTESRVMSDLNHPNIVRVHHAGEDKGLYYIVMDYIEGPEGSPRTLQDHLDHQRGSGIESTRAQEWQEEVQRIALQICEGLDHAHQKGIIHRDLKPANILLDKDLNVRIVDFGLAKVVGEEYLSELIKQSVSLSIGKSIGELDTEFANQRRPQYEGTSTGALLGTYEYMSPEQKAGARVSKQSDIYALGVILYRMLTGANPQGMAKPPSFYGASKKWDPIVGKCLETHFHDRFEDVKTLSSRMKTLRFGGSPKLKLLSFAALLAIASGTWIFFQQGAGDAVPQLGTGRLDGLRRGETETVTDPEPEVPFVTAFSPDQETVALHVKPRPANSRVMLVRGIRRIADAIVPEEGYTFNVPPGEYDIIISREGFIPYRSTIDVHGESETFERSLSRPRGSLAVTTSEGTNVTLLPMEDGADTPIDLGVIGSGGRLFNDNLLEGRYRLLLSKSNYEPHETTINIEQRIPAEYEHVMQPKPGMLFVPSTRRATLYSLSDGNVIGNTDEDIRLSAGEHRLLARVAGFRDLQLTVRIPPNGDVVYAPALDFTPERGAVRLDLSIPNREAVNFFHRQDMRILLNNQPVEVPNNSKQFILDDLICEEHTIRLEVDNFTVIPEHRSITVRDNQTASLQFELIPKPVRVSIQAKDSETEYIIKNFRLNDHQGREITLPAFSTPTLRVSAEGYQSKDVPLSIKEPTRSYERTIKLQPERYKLTIRLAPRSGNIQNARNYQSEGEIKFQGETHNFRGWETFEFTDLQIGDYEIEIIKPGFHTARTTINLNKSDQIETLFLHPLPARVIVPIYPNISTHLNGRRVTTQEHELHAFSNVIVEFRKQNMTTIQRTNSNIQPDETWDLRNTSFNWQRATRRTHGFGF
jgi:serine/threonine protein kinase